MTSGWTRVEVADRLNRFANITRSANVNAPGASPPLPPGAPLRFVSGRPGAGRPRPVGLEMWSLTAINWG